MSSAGVNGLKSKCRLAWRVYEGSTFALKLWALVGVMSSILVQLRGPGFKLRDEIVGFLNPVHSGSRMNLPICILRIAPFFPFFFFLVSQVARFAFVWALIL